MPDMPFFGSVIITGGGEGGTTNYDVLSNKPVVNLTGSPVIICEQATGVYNIDGTWSITADDVIRETLKDDLFYVLNDDDGCKLTWVSAGDIRTFRVTKGGSASNIVEDSIATSENITSSLVGSF